MTRFPWITVRSIRPGPGSFAPQPSSIHLAQVGPGERLHEDHLARVLVGLQAIAHERPELLVQAVSARPGHDVRARLHEPVWVGRTDDGPSVTSGCWSRHPSTSCGASHLPDTLSISSPRPQ